MRLRHVAIFTVTGDLHALAVANAINGYADVRCSVVETNRLSGSSGVTWPGQPEDDCTIPTLSGHISVADIDVAWWRRVNASQVIDEGMTNPAHAAVIHTNCRETLRGIMETAFHGAWVSEPQATERAENKLVQLRAASRAGFRVPRTLISQNPSRIREFCRSLDHRVVVKAVCGARGVGSLLADMLTDEMLESEESLKLCPTIFQEYVPGRFHVRANCFGDQVYAALLESEQVDWRPDHTTPMHPWPVPDELRRRLGMILRLLGLRMGVVDLKLDAEGQAVWLEINPQGQFLFVEAATGLPLAELFASFLRSEANSPSR